MASPPAFRIRPATDEDSELFYRVKKEAMEEYVAAAFGGWHEGYQRTLHEKRFAAHRARVILVAGEPVGTLRLRHSPTEIRLHSLFLRPEWQGRGIGTRIIEMLRRTARRDRLPIRLTVLKSNPRARAFWERSGFRVVGEEEHHDVLVHPPGEGPQRLGTREAFFLGTLGLGFLGAILVSVLAPEEEHAELIGFAGTMLLLGIARIACELPAERRALRRAGALRMRLPGSLLWTLLVLLGLAIHSMVGPPIGTAFLGVLALAASGILLRRGGVWEGGIRLTGELWFVPWEHVLAFEWRGAHLVLTIALGAPAALPPILRVRIAPRLRKPLEALLREYVPTLDEWVPGDLVSDPRPSG